MHLGRGRVLQVHFWAVLEADMIDSSCSVFMVYARREAMLFPLRTVTEVMGPGDFMERGPEQQWKQCFPDWQGLPVDKMIDGMLAAHLESGSPSSSDSTWCHKLAILLMAQRLCSMVEGNPPLVMTGRPQWEKNDLYAINLFV